ncbi:MAG: BsuBI/PstI family type II restriction endonuclease [Blastocatellia bacterium]
MKDYFPRLQKTPQLKKLLNEAVEILTCAGIPVDKLTERRLERMVLCFLAVAGVTRKWAQAQGLDDNRFLKTREIIEYINRHFEENISSGSYDDIRRKDLKLPVMAGLIINSGHNPGAATNDPTRGYSLHPEFKVLVRTFGTEEWKAQLDSFLSGRELLSETLTRQRKFNRIPVKLPDGKVIELSVGGHNRLQKLIIEDFLPRFGQGCEVLYLGDTAHRILHLNQAALKELQFFDLSHDKLPDVLAYNRELNWLYLIEAVHSSGPLSEVRVLELRRMAKGCTAKLIFVTAFLTKRDFRKWMLDIAWETEVWIAETPDHLIHFDGEKYLSPY